MANEANQANQKTEMLRDSSGNPRGELSETLLKVIYSGLRRQAHCYLRNERLGHTLQTTALVHGGLFQTH